MNPTSKREEWEAEGYQPELSSGPSGPASAGRMCNCIPPPASLKPRLVHAAQLTVGPSAKCSPCPHACPHSPPHPSLPPPPTHARRKIYNNLVPDVFGAPGLSAPKLEEAIGVSTQRKIAKLQEYVQKNPSKAAKVRPCGVPCPPCVRGMWEREHASTG